MPRPSRATRSRPRGGGGGQAWAEAQVLWRSTHTATDRVIPPVLRWTDAEQCRRGGGGGACPGPCLGPWD